jgi:hypothetical protein
LTKNVGYASVPSVGTPSAIAEALKAPSRLASSSEFDEDDVEARVTERTRDRRRVALDDDAADVVVDVDANRLRAARTTVVDMSLRRVRF